MGETRLQVLANRWRDSSAVDDELAYLQERVNCGEPQRRTPGEPLRQRIEALAELYGTGRRQALLGRIAAERGAAGPVWFAYWDALHSGLDQDSKLRQEGIAARDYRIANALAILCTRHGQPLAKAILRELAPQYASLSLAECRIVRVLGSSLDPREDLDARLLLVDLLERSEIDSKSGLQFLSALFQAGLDACLPALERRLATCMSDQQAVLELLTGRGERAPSVALREALETWDDPSWLVFQVVLRGDREALPALRAALGRLAPGGLPARMVGLAIEPLVAGVPVPASLLSTLREHMYGRLELNLPEHHAFIDRETSRAKMSLSEQLLERASTRFESCDRLDELTRWHRLDPRFSPELALVVLAEAARGDPRPEIRRAACRVIWDLGMLEID
jgi:hypothetical protein